MTTWTNYDSAGGRDPVTLRNLAGALRYCADNGARGLGGWPLRDMLREAGRWTGDAYRPGDAARAAAAVETLASDPADA